LCLARRHGRANLNGGSEGGSSEADKPTSWRRLSGVMMSAFGWSPDHFWNATPHETWACIEARQEATKGTGAK
jgi:hypothetical protein